MSPSPQQHGLLKYPISTPLSNPERTDMKSRIKQFVPQFQRRLAGASGVLLMLFAGQPGLAQQSASRTPVATASALPAAASIAGQPGTAAAADERETAASGKSLDGTIKVHGHWVIDLTNPDGTLADHRDFENSLAVGQGGDSLLIGLLAGYYVPGDYGILLQGPACTTAAPAACIIVKSISTMPGTYVCAPGNASACSASLAYNFVLAPNSGSTSIILSGFVATPNTGTITTVSTFYSACDSVNGYTGTNLPILPTGPSTFPPANCVGSNNSAIIDFLTATNSFTPLQVTSAGQVIHVTVTITFS
jgi:hypothetical protein